MDYNNIIKYTETTDYVSDIKNIIENAKDGAYYTANIFLVCRNFLIGKRIAEEELSNNRKDNYGKEIIKELSKELTNEYGKGFNKTNLYNYYLFYKLFPNIFHTVCGKSYRILSWSHYRTLLLVDDDEARSWYEKECIEQNWSVRVLQRNISTQYYQRLLLSHKKKVVVDEMIDKTKNYEDTKLEFIKSPLIAEFLGFQNKKEYSEKDLESAIIDHIEDFIMELGKGYAFVGRQVRIETDWEDYYIDLVFYNYILKSFVLIDLKTNKINHQDLGQMDMYIRMYDELKKGADDNPTIGILLCAETDRAVAKYSILRRDNQIFMSKYKLYLPKKEELEREIEKQKEEYYFKNNDNKINDTEIPYNIYQDIINAIKEITDLKIKNKDLKLAVVELGKDFKIDE